MIARRIWWGAFVCGMGAMLMLGWWRLGVGPESARQAAQSDLDRATLLLAEQGRQTQQEQQMQQGQHTPGARQDDSLDSISEQTEQARQGLEESLPAPAAPETSVTVPAPAVQTLNQVSAQAERLWKLRSVKVLLKAEQRVERLPIEMYVRGVLAGEMPESFELEALKAQAIAARTYIVKRLKNGESVEAGKQVADVTDTVAHQAYVSLQELEEQGLAGLDKLNQAVQETAGIIMTYEGEPIEASYFSTSSGHTENSEDYWNVEIPYLRSVPSPWDAELSPRYAQETEMKLSAFYAKLGVPRKSRQAGSIKVVSTTTGGNVEQLQVGKEVYSGREVREALGLPSSHFTWTIAGDRIVWKTLGYGHGVGMSQWGANGMALEGKTAEEILHYYYSGIRLEQAALTL